MKSILRNKRVLLSGGIILALAAVLVTGTIAFYNDSETSQGNIFVAGAIDLKVDHLKQTYNGEDCTTLCTHWPTEVISFNQGLKKDGGAVDANRSNPEHALGPAQTSGAQNDGNTTPADFVSLGFGGSIVLHFPDGIDDGVGDDIRIYEGTNGGSYPDEKILVEVSPNNIDWTTVYTTPDNVTFDGTVELDLADVGDAPLVYYVRITDQSNPDLHNSAADGFDLDAVEAIHCENPEIDGLQSDIWQCQLWEQTDLGDHYFFNFSDIKPGDWGNNVISLHVFDNDANMCLVAHEGVDDENVVYEPEEELGDDDVAGELQNYIEVFTWLDLDADGVFEDGETPFEETTLGNLGTLANMDTDNGLFLDPEQTAYVGLAWCAGDLVVDYDNYTVDCDGGAMLNDAQSDSFSASLTAYVEQLRNNEGFSCDAYSEALLLEEVQD